jgi:hypothetical protein
MDSPVGHGLSSLVRYADTLLDKCRYTYVEYTTFEVEHPGGFGWLMPASLGQRCAWAGCWESSASEEGKLSDCARLYRTRRVLLRFFAPVSEAEALGAVLLRGAVDLGIQVRRVETWPFSRGYALSFVSERLQLVLDGGAKVGFEKHGNVLCHVAELTAPSLCVHARLVTLFAGPQHVVGTDCVRSANTLVDPVCFFMCAATSTFGGFCRRTMTSLPLAWASTRLCFVAQQSGQGMHCF